MDIRSAILKAADRIESNPDCFEFDRIGVPTCGAPGCALGWIGVYLGMTGSIERVAQALGVYSQTEFYNNIHTLPDWNGWINSASHCARILRDYADAFHPATRDISQPYDWTALVSKGWQIGDTEKSQEVA